MDAMNMGLFLLQLRKERNLTQKDVSTMCNVSTQAVSKWERGESFPDIEILEKLSILYKLSINELINGEKDEIYIDIDRRKRTIALTFSILVFFAYLLNFIRIPNDYIFKGYEVIFNGTGGNTVVVTWITFLLLVSYLIINIFLLAKVMVKSPFLDLFFLLSAITIYVISISGLIIGFYILFPQVIILISTTVIFLMSYNNESLKLTYFSRIRQQVKHERELKREYRLKIKKGENVDEFLIPFDSFKKLFYFFYVFFLLFIAFQILIDSVMIFGIVESITSVTYYASINWVAVSTGFLLIVLILHVLSIRYLKTKMMKNQLIKLSILILVGLVSSALLFRYSLGGVISAVYSFASIFFLFMARKISLISV